MRFLVFFLGFCLTLPPISSYADTLRSIDQLIGKTVIGANRKDKHWAVYLSRNGSARFLYSDRSTATANWRRANSRTLCFSFSHLAREVCKRIDPAGRGLHWRTVGERKPSSELITVLKPGVWPSSIHIQSARSLVGTHLYGRTKNDQNIWHVKFYRNGRFTFFRSSTQDIEYGSYYVDESDICLTFDGDSAVHCRRPSYVAGRFVWSKTSTVLYVEALPETNTVASAKTRSPAFRSTTPIRTASRRRRLESACTTIWVVGSGCQLVGDIATGGKVAHSTAVGVGCVAAMAELEAFEITPAMLVIGGISGALSGASAEALSEGNYVDFLTGWALSAAASKVGYEHCISVINDRCAW